MSSWGMAAVMYITISLLVSYQFGCICRNLYIPGLIFKGIKEWATWIFIGILGCGLYSYVCYINNYYNVIPVVDFVAIVIGNCCICVGMIKVQSVIFEEVKKVNHKLNAQSNTKVEISTI